MLPNPKPAEQFLKFILLQDIIIIPEHRDCQALAKSSGSDKEEELVGTLNLLYEVGFVNIVAVIPSHCFEIHHPVGDSFAVFPGIRINHIGLLSLYQPTKLGIYCNK